MKIKESFIKKVTEIKIRLDRGNQVIYWFRNIVIITAGLKIIIPNIGVFGLFVFGISLLLIFYLIGWVDLKYVKLMQKENELLASKYNPHLNILKKLKRKSI